MRAHQAGRWAYCSCTLEPWQLPMVAIVGKNQGPQPRASYACSLTDEHLKRLSYIRFKLLINLLPWAAKSNAFQDCSKPVSRELCQHDSIWVVMVLEHAFVLVPDNIYSHISTAATVDIIYSHISTATWSAQTWKLYDSHCSGSPL